MSSNFTLFFFRASVFPSVKWERSSLPFRSVVGNTWGHVSSVSACRRCSVTINYQKRWERVMWEQEWKCLSSITCWDGIWGHREWGIIIIIMYLKKLNRSYIETVIYIAVIVACRGNFTCERGKRSWRLWIDIWTVAVDLNCGYALESPGGI